MSDFQLNHLNIPARDPEGLVRCTRRLSACGRMATRCAGQAC